MSQTIIVAIFSLCGVLLGGSLQYIFGRALESRRQLTLQRSQSYVDFFKAVALAAQDEGRSRENQSLAADAKVRICIYGSPGVIKRLGALEIIGANMKLHEARAATIELLKEMRKDLAKADDGLDEKELNRIVFGQVG